MHKVEMVIYLANMIVRLQAKRREFHTFQVTRLTRVKKIQRVPMKLEEWKKSLMVKLKTWHQSGFHQTQVCLFKLKWTTTRWITSHSVGGVRNAWQAEAQGSSTAPVTAHTQCPPLPSTTFS